MRRPHHRPTALVLAGLLATSAACSGGGDSALDQACDGYADLLATALPADGYLTSTRIALVHSDARSVVRITPQDIVATQPSFDPDGERVVFVRHASATTDRVPSTLWTVGVDGEGLEQLTGDGTWDEHPDGGGSGSLDTAPDWSRTGTVAYVHSSYGSADEPDGIYLVEPGGQPEPLLDADGVILAGEGPRWSADGKQLAFGRTDAEGTAMLYVVPAAGGEPRAVTTSAGIHDLTWSHDGSRILFLTGASGPEGSRALRSIDVATGEATEAGVGGIELRFSHDGTRLYGFTPTPGEVGTWRLTTVRLDGDRITAVEQAAAADFPTPAGLDVTTCTPDDD